MPHASNTLTGNTILRDINCKMERNDTRDKTEILPHF